jgi:hypothetical protein
VVKKPKEHPTFRSVANAIRTGIFIEKIYRRMSTSQLMVIPQNLNAFLEVSGQIIAISSILSGIFNKLILESGQLEL